jgi:hypothetical protein
MKSIFLLQYCFALSQTFLGILCFCLNIFFALGNIWMTFNLSYCKKYIPYPKLWVSVFVLLSEGAFCFGIFFCRLNVTSTQEFFGFPTAKMGKIILQQCILMFRIFCKQVFSGLSWRTISLLVYINEENFFSLTKDRMEFLLNHPKP